MRSLLLLLLTACGAQTEQESYLEDFLRENPEARLLSVVGEYDSCWTVDEELDTYISLTNKLSREEVYTLAMECMNLGKAAKE